MKIEKWYHPSRIVSRGKSHRLALAENLLQWSQCCLKMLPWDASYYQLYYESWYWPVLFSDAGRSSMLWKIRLKIWCENIDMKMERFELKIEKRWNVAKKIYREQRSSARTVSIEAGKHPRFDYVEYYFSFDSQSSDIISSTLSIKLQANSAELF